MNYSYKVKIVGKDVRRFIKKMYSKKIYIEDIEMISKKEAYLKLSKEDYFKLLQIKTIYEIEVVKLYGFVRIIDLIKRYYFLIICLIIGYLYLIFLSNIIFDVRVVHSKKQIRELVYKELEKYNIKKYKFIKSYKEKEQIENQILKKNKDKIEWIEIERVGCKYIVKLEERIIKKSKEKEPTRDIVAKKDGIIKKIYATHGEILKKKDDYVKKGDIVISGVIKRKDDIKNIISAEGKIYAEVWYKTNVNMPFYYKEIKYTNKNKKVLKIKFLGKDIYFFNINKYATYKEKELLSVKNSLIPVRFSFSKEYETIVEEKILSKESAIKEAEKRSLEKINSTLDKDEKVLKSKVLSTTEYENYVNVVIFYKVYEDITEYNAIDKDEILKNINKES